MIERSGATGRCVLALREAEKGAACKRPRLENGWEHEWILFAQGRQKSMSSAARGSKGGVLFGPHTCSLSFACGPSPESDTAGMSFEDAILLFCLQTSPSVLYLRDAAVRGKEANKAQVAVPVERFVLHK